MAAGTALDNRRLPPNDGIMRITISHETIYHYDPAANGVIQILRMTPDRKSVV
jgi:hypothetical protein